MLRRFGLAGLLIGCSLLPSSTAIATPVMFQGPKTNWTEQQRKAIAFLLGWNSKALLVQTTAKDRQRCLLSIKLQVRELGLVLEHPVEYYFEYPTADEGARVQEFAAETLVQLRKTNTKVANHFGAAHNLILILAHNEEPEPTRKSKLHALMLFLDIPDALKQVPDRNLLGWATRIKDYFESSLRPTTQTAAAAGDFFR